MEGFRSPRGSGCTGGGRISILNVSEDCFCDICFRGFRSDSGGWFAKILGIRRSVRSQSCPSLVPVLSRSCPSLVPVLSQSCPSLVPVLSRSCPSLVTVLSQSCHRFEFLGFQSVNLFAGEGITDFCVCYWGVIILY